MTENPEPLWPYLMVAMLVLVAIQVEIHTGFAGLIPIMFGG